MSIKVQIFLSHFDLVKFVRAQAITQANIQAIVADTSSGQVALYYWS